MLKEENYESLKVVVEINEEIIPRDSFDTYLIKDGDTVEVLSFVGGGWLIEQPNIKMLFVCSCISEHIKQSFFFITTYI